MNDKPTTEAALATYGTILAVVLSISAFVVGFNKTNVFAALAFLPMIIYFGNEFFQKIFTPQDDSQSPDAPIQYSPGLFTFTDFILQDSVLFRLTISLFIVCLVSIFAKAYISSDLITQVSADIVTPIP